MEKSKEIRLIPLADITQRLRQKCGNADADVSGIDINKSFIDTKANLEETDITKYYLVPPMYFACNLMHIGRDEKIPIAFNNTDRNKVVTSAYYVFTVKPKYKNKFLSEYLNVFFHLGEFDRRAWFFTDSSIRGNLKESRFLDIKIPVPYKNGEPDMERQQEIVDIWQGLRRLKEENEAIAQPLLDICQSKMDELKHSAPMVALGKYISICDFTNFTNEKLPVMGLNKDKVFMPTAANIDGVKTFKYKLIEHNMFAFSGMQTGRDTCIRIAYNESKERFVVSPAYTTFKMSDKEILPQFVYLWFMRSETDRQGWFLSDSSIRSNLDWSRFISIKIPKPSIEVQRAIVDIYHCARRAKEIAEEAAQQLKSICPALMQHIIHS